MYFKKTLNWLGGLLALLGCIFVFYRLYTYWEQVDLSSFSIFNWLIIFCLVIFYSTANILLVVAWQNLLEMLNVKVTFRFAMYAYGVSQLAKYLPGNIFHLAGRQSIGAAVGLPNWPLAKSSIWELAIITITASLFGTLVLPQIIAGFSIHLSGLIFSFTVLSIIIITKHLFNKFISLAIANYVLFLACSGFTFVAVIGLIINPGKLTLELAISICGAYIIAWIAGLVTPGAPAGIGVRELVLLFTLQQYISESHLLTVLIIGRMITCGGDLVLYLIASLLFRNEAYTVDNQIS